MSVALLLVTVCPFSSAAATDRPHGQEIPVVREVDVLVAGGSVAAVAAAVEAARHEAKVLLLAPRMYLGEDMCATLRLWLEDDEEADERLTERIFGKRRTTTPLHVKKTLESALLQSKVDFLLGCYVTDVLVDENGKPSGIAMVNRAGRQAVLAKVIVDATERACVAKSAGARLRFWTSGKQIFRRVVLGGRPTSRVEPTRRIRADVEIDGRQLDYYEYSVELDLGDDSFSARAEAEQQIRDLTYRDGQLRSAERMTAVATASIIGRRSDNEVSVGDFGPLGRFRPHDVDRMYVLSTAADIPRAQAQRLLRPSRAELMGRTIGRAAAETAASIVLSRRIHLPETVGQPLADGHVREVMTGLRATARPNRTVPAGQQRVPVLASAEVVVVGGGTSGACAAIAAARQGVDVLVVEYQEGLGGVGTVGLIGRAYHGQDLGFTAEVPFCDKDHNTEYKMEWFRKAIRASGGRVWLGVLGCGALVQGNCLKGAVVATPNGRGVVLADVVIDATGNGDLAVAAGAESMYGADDHDIALQGTGLPMRPLGESYVNTDYLLVDEADAVDTWRALVGVRLGSDSAAFDMGTFIQTRERRRVVGDHMLDYLDQIAGRTYPDSIVLSGSDYDSHGYPSDVFFALIPHTEKTRTANHPAPGGSCYTPYRCLLPRGLEGMLVTGLAISMRRDASAMVRMQKDMHNQGYAAGVAAAMAARGHCTPRQVDVRRLQQHLVGIGNLPESVLTDEDSFPLSERLVRQCVAQITDPRLTRPARCQALAIVLAHRQQARPVLRQAYAAAAGDVRLTYAKMLGFLGEPDGVGDLIDALDRIDAWDAKIYQGHMAEYAHLPTPIDAIILALGYTRDRRATEAILKKLSMLDADVTLSHHRAVALALERIGDPVAAEPIAKLLGQPAMGGHAMMRLEPLYDRQRQKRRRIGPLREIVLARALYRCGDHERLGQSVLRLYQRDVRGLFARHATAVLGDLKP